tara:strand:+ start:776 stop:1186 length:411 start_codon:yes stop_codon:yes gene_type:complete
MIKLKIENLKSDFDVLESPMDKYQYIIDLGKEKGSVNKDIRYQKNVIKGCVSKAWMEIDCKNNKIKIITDSDALIVKGLLSILENLVDNINTEEVKDLNGAEVLKDIGLGYSISSQRTNGFIGAINKMKMELNFGD